MYVLLFGVSGAILVTIFVGAIVVTLWNYKKVKIRANTIIDRARKNYQVKNMKKCPKCGAEASNEALFCGICGAKLVEAPPPPAIPRTCPSCGAEIKPEMVYCPICGQRIMVKKTCPSCGHENLPDAKFCRKCGSQLDVEAKPLEKPVPTPVAPPAAPEERRKRPAGLTILAILYGVVGPLSALYNISVTSENLGVLQFLLRVGLQPGLNETQVFSLLGLAVLTPLIGTVTGVLQFSTAYGFWRGRSWARMLAIVFIVMAMATNGLALFYVFALEKILQTSLGSAPGILIGSIIHAAIVLPYLTRPHVKAYLGARAAP